MPLGGQEIYSYVSKHVRALKYVSENYVIFQSIELVSLYDEMV